MDLLESIRIFKRVTEKESFSSVASEMGVTQPTISKAIASLEESLGVTLFRRSTRGLSLTNEGQKLLLMGGPLLEQLDVVLAAVKNEKLQLKGHLRVTASLAFARLMLAPLFDQFSDIHPDLKMHFNLSDGHVNLIETGIDLAIRIGKLEDSTLKAFKIGTSRRALYISKKYIKKFGAPKNLEDMKNHRLLYYTRLNDRPTWPLLNTKGEPAPYYFEPHFMSDGSDLIREGVISGTGIALMPTWMMIEQEKDKSVVRLFEKNSPTPSPIFLVTASTQEMTAKQRVVADFLKKQFELIPALSLREN